MQAGLYVYIKFVFLNIKWEGKFLAAAIWKTDFNVILVSWIADIFILFFAFGF